MTVGNGRTLTHLLLFSVWLPRTSHRFLPFSHYPIFTKLFRSIRQTAKRWSGLFVGPTTMATKSPHSPRKVNQLEDTAFYVDEYRPVPLRLWFLGTLLFYVSCLCILLELTI